MTRTVRTLLVSVAALAALGTAAIAAPSALMSTDMPSGMSGMHTTESAHLHMASSGMAQMHAAMTSDPAVDNAMLNDPTMLSHLAEYNIDVDQMRQWHNEGRSVDEMHATLATQGIDTNVMQANCPMSANDSMENMHRGGHDVTHTSSMSHRRGELK